MGARTWATRTTTSSMAAGRGSSSPPWSPRRRCRRTSRRSICCGDARFRWKLRPRQVTGDTKYGTSREHRRHRAGTDPRLLPVVGGRPAGRQVRGAGLLAGAGEGQWRGAADRGRPEPEATVEPTGLGRPFPSGAAGIVLPALPPLPALALDQTRLPDQRIALRSAPGPPLFQRAGSFVRLPARHSLMSCFAGSTAGRPSYSVPPQSP